jgi:hypothetical protein
MLDTKALAATLLQTVREWVEPAFKAMDARMRSLEQRAAVPGPKGEPGERGADGAAGERGEKGEAGKSFTLEEVRALVDEAVQRAVAELPAPKDGADGRDGKDGVDGKSITPDEVRTIIAELHTTTIPSFAKQVTEFLDAIPKPKDGEPGKSVTAEDLQPLLKSMHAEWALDFERFARGVLDNAAARIPIPKDGRDALPVDGI